MSLSTANSVWAAGLQSFMQGQPNMKIMGFVAETGSFMQPQSNTATVSSSNTGASRVGNNSSVTFNGQPGYSIPAGGEGFIPILSPSTSMQLFAVVENDGSSNATSPAIAANSYNAANSYTSTAESWISQLESMVGFQPNSPAQNVPAPGTNDLAMLLSSSPLEA